LIGGIEYTTAVVSAFDEACLKLFCSDDTFIVAIVSNLKITIEPIIVGRVVVYKGKPPQ
jgi:hypothetical protein